MTSLTSEESFIEIRTQFKDFLARYEADQKEAKEWRNMFEIKLKDLSKQIEPLVMPYKFGLWVFTISGAAILAEAVKNLVLFLRGHIH